MATTTPNYGWDVPTSTDYVKDGATAIETLGDDIDSTLYQALGFNYPGLRLIKKQTIGSGVSTVTVNDAFSATYENYKIIVSGGVGSTSAVVQCFLGGTEPANGYYAAGTFTNYSAGATAVANNNNASRFNRIGYNTTNSIQANVEFHSPFATKNTMIMSNFIGHVTSGDAGTFMGYLNNSTSFTSFTILPSSGTWTGGTIYVYGYGIGQ
jgi:hypothetical protein